MPSLRGVQAKLILEPGRSIVGNAGILLTQVQFLKDKGHKHFVIVDAGMNDLIRPAINLRLSPHRAGGGKRCEIHKDRLVVSYMRNGDFLALDRGNSLCGEGRLLGSAVCRRVTVLPCLPTTTQDPRHASLLVEKGKVKE
jgi:diaminopimelate decarboxylase